MSRQYRRRHAWPATSRRTFLKLGLAAGATLFLPRYGLVTPPGRRAAAQMLRALALAGGSLDPNTIAKYVTPLAIPPAMPPVTGSSPAIDYYAIRLRQFQQQILPAGQPQTTVWSYSSHSDDRALFYPAFTIEARYNRPVRVQWINGLVDRQGNYLPHLLPVDPTLHWANPPGGVEGRDMRPMFEETPGRYTGPVPMVTHVHGAHTHEESDGYAEAWFLPAARNIPAGFATVGSFYNTFKTEFQARWGQVWAPGTAVFQYPNDQAAATLWYHDHTLGMTRLNVYAGPAGFYLLRGGPNDLPRGVLPGPAPAVSDRAGTRYYEIPIAIQDRSFNADGSLFYPDSRAFFDEFGGPYIPDSDISPIWNPEVFGNTMVVNGRSWPYLNVEPRRYRFRLLNGCSARFLILKLVGDPLAARPATPALPFWQIGAEGGYLPAPVELPQLLMAPAERADVIVDFTGLPPGAELYLINEAPDEPFGGGEVGDEFEPSDPTTTGQVMKFRVVPLVTSDTSTPPGQLGTLPSPAPLTEPGVPRKLALIEEDSEVLEDVGPREAVLGELDAEGNPIAHAWMDDITENPALGSTEVWEIHNFTADAHPIHIHLVQFQVVNRQPLVSDEEGMAVAPAVLAGEASGPEPWETGFKDTVVAYPGQVTRVKARFDRAGLFAWHCHIVEHEDNEMMRPYRVGP